MEQYTKITIIEYSARDKEYKVYLKVGNQYFCVTPTPYATRKEANWMRKQLVTALRKIKSDIERKEGGA